WEDNMEATGGFFNVQSIIRGMAFGAALLGLCGVSTAEDAVKVKMGTSAPITSIVYLPTVLADILGYYKDEGIDFELEQFNGGSPAAAGLVNGSVDVLTGNYNHTIQLAAQGKQVIAFAQMTQTPGLVLVVSPKTEKKIDSIADLKGAHVGVS